MDTPLSVVADSFGETEGASGTDDLVSEAWEDSAARDWLGVS